MTDAWKALLAGPSSDFPRGPAPGAALPRRWLTLAALVAACLLPRAVAAWNWDVLWGDTLHYHHASLALERGDFERGFAEFGLNIYPLLLIPLRHLGIDWQIAGKWFGAIVAVCTVIPLWGWLRRMFDDRLAILACLVYALHGKLIAISPLIIRDPTFWFLLVTSLYLFWRAIGELRIVLFLVAGIVLTLAVHTRTEGWLLLVPLLGWAACRWPTATGQRARLIVGVLLCMAVIPSAVALVNVTWLRDNPRWEFLRATHVDMVLDWWRSVSPIRPPVDCDSMPETGNSPDNPPSGSPSSRSPAEGAPPSETRGDQRVAEPPPLPSILLPETVSPERKATPWGLTFKLLERVVKGCTWVGSLLLAVGLIGRWRVFFRREHLTLLAMNVLLLIVSWIRYRNAGLDLRYFMPIVIVGVPWMALGLQHLLVAACRLWGRGREPSLRASRIVTVCLVGALILGSLLDGPMSAATHMRKHAALGRWIGRHAGPSAALAGNIDELSLETFYSQGTVIAVVWPRDCLIVPMPAVLPQRKADVLVLWNLENLSPEQMAIVEDRLATHCGYRRIRPEGVPVGENELFVFVRKE